MLERPAPVLVVDLFPRERAALLGLLASLEPEDWHAPTACEGWSVKDVAAHLVADDLGRLSRGRDGWSAAGPEPGERLVDFVDRQNARWVEATRRLSPRVVCALLEWSGAATQAWFASLDPYRLGAPVSWAGPDPAPVWLDIGREFTERWHHQQHIRDAVGVPPLTDSTFLRPVIATFAFALPEAFRALAASDGTTVQLTVGGESGGTWTVRREGDRWSLYVGGADGSDARVVLDQDAAWRLFTKGLSPADAERRADLSGDLALARQSLESVAIIA